MSESKYIGADPELLGEAIDILKAENKSLIESRISKDEHETLKNLQAENERLESEAEHLAGVVRGGIEYAKQLESALALKNLALDRLEWELMPHSCLEKDHERWWEPQHNQVCRACNERQCIGHKPDCWQQKARSAGSEK